MDLEIDNTQLYDELVAKKKGGYNFKKEDLTEDILYKLAIEENIPDSLIGDIFGLKKKQVRHLRVKYNMSNVFLKRAVNDKNGFVNFMINNDYTDYISMEDVEKYYYPALEMFAKSKNWNIDTFHKYVEEKEEKDANETKKNNDSFLAKYENLNTKKELINKGIEEEFDIKNGFLNMETNTVDPIELSKIIVLPNEERRLKKLNINFKQDDIKAINGKDYQIESLDKNGNKIYIIVKGSLNAKEKNVVFQLSTSELEFLKKNKDNCYIYYVMDIKRFSHDAKILVINYEDLNNYELDINYEVKEKVF